LTASMTASALRRARARPCARLCDNAAARAARRYVDDPEAVAAALARVWGVLEAALARFRDDERCAEHLCRAPRYALRTAVRRPAPGARGGAPGLLPAARRRPGRRSRLCGGCTCAGVAKAVHAMLRRGPASRPALSGL